MDIIGIIVLVAIAGFVAYKVFGNKDSVAPAPVKAPTPAPAPKKAPVVEAKAEPKPKAKAPSKAELTKLTKKALDEKAAAEGIKLDARKTKDAMIKDFQKEFKAQQK